MDLKWTNSPPSLTTRILFIALFTTLCAKNRTIAMVIPQKINTSLVRNVWFFLASARLEKSLSMLFTLSMLFVAFMEVSLYNL